ncbi:SGNH/GDSL hydrolase family protein [Streptomyces sp. GbtcB7]|uniref:SGNH/GDSL hydrolase family protein n=1 Tax=Streptomyces sp. GbtcB7 TaxID=2824752 RepID=UPI0020C61332|nr:SGNH/GDSL hydrolase family protein [Streptomyces sp. GbtcB7]
MKTSARAGLAVMAAGGIFFAATSLGDHDDSATAAPKSAAVSGEPSHSTVSGAPESTDASGSSAGAGPYVALGDSYTAGPGIPSRTGTPTGCDRSDHNYPTLVAHELGVKTADFRDMSCTGATVDDLTAPQTTDHGTNPAQLSALTAHTALVTLGIGGNDIGFSKLITQCAKSGILYFATGSGKYTGDHAPCRSQYVDATTDTVRQKINTVGDRLADTLAEVKRRAPQARVYVVGYPAILPATAGDCGRDMGLAPGDVAFLHQEQQRLNTTLRERAEGAGAGYVDTYAPSNGHDACSARETRWVEPLVPLAPAAPVHPNARGERGMADTVINTIDASKGS